MSDQKEPAEKKRRGIIIIAIVFAVLVAALVLCIVLLLRKQEPVQEIEDTSQSQSTLLNRGFVDESNADNVMDEMSEKVSQGMFECKMTTAWTFDDGKSESPNAYVANVENNLYTLYFDVYEEATNELLYSSPMLPVGTELKNFKLDKELDAGEYNAVVMYTMVDEDLEEVSTVGFKVTISILK
ncbi:MAG: hypothetical protein HDR29_07220 [Lachnospiraceae bacterium]|nr:hypothetical protein [Lachnospiraceae bacterium]